MVRKITVKKVLSNEETKALEGKRLPKGYYKTVIQNEDVDVYTEDGEILLMFRKNVLPKSHIDAAYENMIEFAKKKTTTRGIAAGMNGKPKMTGMNDPIMSNIMGYFDTVSVRQKYILNQAKMKIPKCRETSFTGKFPEKWKNVVPLIKDIDAQYKKLLPEEHHKQLRETNKTKYKIPGTAFTTITTNLNLQTAVHKDKGDYREGFGNLVVLEKGKYNGGYTGFPQYGVAVDVRSGDFLAMDVHQFHGNEPIEPVTEDAERLSIVSYMREGIVTKCKGEEIVGDAYFRKASMKNARMKAKSTNNKTRKQLGL